MGVNLLPTRPDDFLHRCDHIFQIFLRHFGVEGKGEYSLGGVFRDRQGSLRVAKSVAVKRMEMDGPKMNPNADILSLEGIHDVVPVDSERIQIQKDGIEVVGMFYIRFYAKKLYFRDFLESSVVLMSIAFARFPELLDAVKLVEAKGRLEIEHIVFVSRVQDLPMTIAFL
jgi:hypothetical protein